jgi:ABC-type nitrate/sulfonate/bicarbonate transport system substrate-binding protein
MEHPDEAAEILQARLPELDLAFVKSVVHDLNGENLWGVDGGLDPKVEEYTADLNVKLGNLPRAATPAEILEPRFVDAALKKLGPYKAK